MMESMKLPGRYPAFIVGLCLLLCHCSKKAKAPADSYLRTVSIRNCLLFYDELFVELNKTGAITRIEPFDESSWKWSRRDAAFDIAISFGFTYRSDGMAWRNEVEHAIQRFVDEDCGPLLRVTRQEIEETEAGALVKLEVTLTIKEST